MTLFFLFLFFTVAKCDTCAVLSHARRSFRDAESRAHITKMHALHRIAYMGERKWYHHRSMDAINDPANKASLISDGMAQHHCSLPHRGQKSDFQPKLRQHFQGIINHGRGFRIYRTFHNVQLNANAQLHCLLLELEAIYRKEKKLPDTLYLQIDGGIENVAKVVLCLLELLVARRLTKTIYLSRLLVGHTHEDIDARFGVLWLFFRLRDVLTPQDYKMFVEAAFGPATAGQMHDVWVVPDYSSIVTPEMDKKFSKYCREGWTQHQFKWVFREL